MLKNSSGKSAPLHPRYIGPHLLARPRGNQENDVTGVASDGPQIWEPRAFRNGRHSRSQRLLGLPVLLCPRIPPLKTPAYAVAVLLQAVLIYCTNGFGSKPRVGDRLASKRFLLTYPDGSRKHIGREERDSLLLSRSARETADGRYLYTGETHTYHALSQLQNLVVSTNEMGLRSFLSGQFIFELGDTRKRELLETPEAMLIRLGL